MKQLMKNNGVITIAAFVLMLATLACTCTNALPFGDDNEEADADSGELTEADDNNDDSSDSGALNSNDDDGNDDSTSSSSDSGNVTYVTATSEDAGITIDYPSDWYIEEDFGFEIYSDASLADSDAIGDGAGVFVLGGFPSDMPAMESLETFLEGNEDFTNIEIISGPDSMTINGNEAAQMTVSADVEGEMAEVMITVINSADNSAFVLAISHADYASDYEDIFATIADSVVLTTPVGFDFSEDPEPTQEVVTEDPEPTAESSSGNLGTIGGNAGDGPGLVLDRIISGEATSGSPAVFTFQARSGRDVAFITVSPSEADLTLTLRGPGGEEIAYQDDTISDAEYIYFDPPADGQYTVEVAPFSGQGDFLLGVIGLAADAPAMLLTDSANTGNGPVEYNLTAGEDGAFIIYLDPLDEEDVTLTLLDSNGNEVEYSDAGFSGEPEAILYPVDGGEYTLVVDNFTSGNTNYDIYIAGAPLAGPPPAGAGGNSGNAGGNSGNSGDIDGAAIASTDEFGDRYPVIDGAYDAFEIGSDFTYSLEGLSLAEVVEFYRYQASQLGFNERGQLTVISGDVVSLVFDGSDEGALVVQAVATEPGVVTIVLRFEDI